MIIDFMYLSSILGLSLAGGSSNSLVDESFMELLLSSNVVLEGRISDAKCDQFRSDAYACDFFVDAEDVILHLAHDQGVYGGDSESDFKVTVREKGIAPTSPHSHYFLEMGEYLEDGGSAYMFLVCKTEAFGSYCAFSGPSEEAVKIPSDEGVAERMERIGETDWPICIIGWDHDLYGAIRSDLERLGRGGEGAVTAEDIVEYGDKSVPYLILMMDEEMDEDSSLSDSSIEFSNPDDFFESHANYGPLYNVEVIDTVLYRYASRRVSSLNRTLQSDGERKHAANAWSYWWNQANCPELNRGHIGRLVNQE